MLTFFIGDLLPIIVIMLLGYFSGRRETFSEDQARAFNKLVLNYAPCSPICFYYPGKQGNDFCGHSSDPCITRGYCRMFLFLLVWLLQIFKRTHAEAAVCALIAGSPTIDSWGLQFSILFMVIPYQQV